MSTVGISCSSRSILNAIGNTPCIPLKHVIPQGCAQVFLKSEGLNPTGSYKDRMAQSIIEQAESRGDLRPGMTVVEASGGSTGSSLAFVCAAMGYKFHVVSSNAFAIEKLRTIRAFGGKVDLIHSPSGKITSTLIPSMKEKAEILSKRPDYYATNQFDNQDAFLGYAHMANELIEQFPSGIDGFCGAVGTAGMVMGVSKVLKAKWPHTRVLALEPTSSPVITKGQGGSHGVEGIGIGFMPPLLDKDLFDEARSISEDQGREMCRRLAKEEGILVGTSSGLNVVAAIELAKELGPDKIVVTIGCDSGLKYLHGDLYTDPQ